MIYDKEKYKTFMKHFDPSVIIGKGTDGEYFSLKLSQIVHLLFGGESGSGKSIFVLQLIFQILFITNPDTLKLILIDPLKVSFKDFRDLPHLLFPVGSEAGEAVEATNAMMRINNERYTFLENVGFEDIYQYNEALLKNQIPYKGKDGIVKILGLEDIPDEYVEKTRTENYSLGEPVPQVICFFDEFNKLMMDVEFGGKNPSEASTPALKNLVGISEQARKAGIIMVLGTQKISADSVPTKVRGNLKTRISLKVSSTMASKVILGDTPMNNGDGSKLAGSGDLLCFNEKLSSDMGIRGQAFYTSMEDMIDLINGLIKKYGKNQFEYIKVNKEYAQSNEDLEQLPIDYDKFKIGLPELIIVKNNIFLQSKFVKILSELIRNPFTFDEKVLALRYPSTKKDLKVVKQAFIDGKVLSINKFEKEKDGYLGLNVKMPGIKYIYDKYGIIPEDKTTWPTEDENFQIDTIKLCLINLNKTFNKSASDISLDLSKYGS